ncbi:hypothetical protein [Thalassotalea sp. PLHSN55]|uniref:hypothetical protein n=1 Tax=Thalassotalea sp. PLHSN55 TaxID=3435888 RepID=UPI003F873A00
MKTRQLILAVAVTSLVAACSSTKETEIITPTKVTQSLPDWVLNPNVENSISATDCVKFSGNISVDKKMATANARLALAQQIETRIEGLDKTYISRTDADNDIAVGNTFSSVSKQVTKQTLNGSRVLKSAVVNIAGKEHFCALTALTPEVTQKLFNSLIKESKRAVNSQDEKFLYEEFKAYKAEQDLDKEIARLTN